MTMFGIIWGTMTVIILLAFGVGVQKQMSKNMHGIGEGIAIVWPGSTSIPFEGYGRDRRIRPVQLARPARKVPLAQPGPQGRKGPRV